MGIKLISILPTKGQAKVLKFYFTFLMALTGACSNQTVHKAPLNDNTTTIKSTTDTTFRLNFPSGIRSILEDSQGNFWFGSHQEGLCLFDGKKMTYFTTKNGLSDNQIRSIFEDSNGKIWFEGGNGISSYDGKKITTHTEKDYSATDKWQTAKNDLWFKGDEISHYNQQEQHPGVYRYDGNLLSYLILPISSKENYDFSYSISTPFCKGKNGMVWFGTYNAVFGYNGTAFTIIDNKSLGLNETTGYLHVRSIFEDSKGKLWIGNNGIGVLQYDGDTTINFSAVQGLISANSQHSGGYRSPPKSLEHVFAIGEDTKGNIWFGDRDTGAWKYDGKSMQNYTLKDGLTATHIWQIYNTKAEKLWFALADGSIFQFNGTSFDRVF